MGETWEPLDGAGKGRGMTSNSSTVVVPTVKALISCVVQRNRMFSSSGLTTWIRQTFTVTSEHICFLLFGFSVLHFLVVGSVR